MEKRSSVMKDYQDSYLLGCCGSINVVQLKWSCCPAGEFNWACGKESFRSLLLNVLLTVNIIFLEFHLFSLVHKMISTLSVLILQLL